MGEVNGEQDVPWWGRFSVSRVFRSGGRYTVSRVFRCGTGHHPIGFTLFFGF